ncbi:MAG: hypothetical protein K2K74_17730 [Lachnospiraceae bacterium]|nr:hypothetical protein [Lachnospiraceae bacterium]
MLFILSWMFPVILVILAFLGDSGGIGGIAGIPENMFIVGVLGCVFVFVYVTINTYRNGDALDRLFDPIEVFDRLSQIGCIVDLIFFIAGIFISHTETISRWVKENTPAQNAGYVFALFAVIVLNLLAARFRRAEAKGILEIALFSPGLQKLMIGFCLLVPALVLYTFNGMPGDNRFATLSPIPFSQWQWLSKLYLIAFLLSLAKCILLEGIVARNFPGVLRILAQLANVGVVAFIFVVLERPLQTVRSFIIYLPLLVIEGFFQFYSYIFILYSAIDFFRPGAITATRKAREAQDLRNAGARAARAEYEQKLDGEERILNALSGHGPYTDDEALALGKESAGEYLTGRIRREQKLSDFEKKQ